MRPVLLGGLLSLGHFYLFLWHQIDRKILSRSPLGDLEKKADLNMETSRSRSKQMLQWFFSHDGLNGQPLDFPIYTLVSNISSSSTAGAQRLRGLTRFGSPHQKALMTTIFSGGQHVHLTPFPAPCCTKSDRPPQESGTKK